MFTFEQLTIEIIHLSYSLHLIYFCYILFIFEMCSFFSSLEIILMIAGAVGVITNPSLLMCLHIILHMNDIIGCSLNRHVLQAVSVWHMTSVSGTSCPFS